MHYSLIDGVKSGHNILSAFSNTMDLDKQDPFQEAKKNRSFGNSHNKVNYLESIHEILQRLEEKFKEEDKTSDLLDEWKCVATIVDRLCFIVIFSLTVLLTVALFVNGYVRSTIIPEPDY